MRTAVYNMNIFILSLIIYCVVASPINTVNNNSRIIGGFDAYAGQFPYQASIVYMEHPLEGVGSGSIISNQWILTSAQCTIITTTDNMRIVVGSIYLNSGGTTHTVLFSVRHPDFDENPEANDVGLIRINGQIVYNDFVRPIELTSDAISVGLPFTVSGWGPISYPEQIIPNTLQYITLKSITLDECKKRFPDPLYDTQMCTDNENGQSLCGDYGSPLVYNGKQHAIASLPFSCVFQIPDVHIRIAPFRSWIKEISNV